MARGRVSHALRYLHGLIGRPDRDAHPDQALLELFATRRDEAAFAAVVERHGALVYGTAF